MFKKLCKSLSPLLLLVAVPVLAAEPVPLAEVPYNCDYSPSCEVAPGIYGAMSSPVTSKFKLSLGGYVKLDYAHNSNASGPTTNPAGATPGGFKEESIFTAKQSRIWFKVSGPTFLGAKTNALVEADFFGANSLSNEFGNMRMRHAYGSIDWSTTQVLFGQFWDVFGPAAADTIDFRQGGDSGAANNPRVPQIRLTQKLNFNSDNSMKFVLGVQNPVQDTPVNFSGAQPSAGTVGSTYGDMVNVAGQIMFVSKALGVSPGFMGLGMSPLQVGLFGQVGNVKIVGSSSVNTYGYGLYAFVPLIRSSDGKSRAMTLSLEGQAYQAAGMNVQGATSQALTSSSVGTSNAQAAKGIGFFGQLKFYPTQDLGLTAGYTHRNALDYNDYVNRSTPATIAASASNQRYNEISYVNATYDLNAAIRLATEYEHHATHYVGIRPANTPAGTNNNASDYGQNNVFRFAAYYFF